MSHLIVETIAANGCTSSCCRTSKAEWDVYPWVLFSGLPVATSPNIRKKRKGKEWLKDGEEGVDISGGEEDLRGRLSLHKRFFFFSCFSI